MNEESYLHRDNVVLATRRRTGLTRSESLSSRSEVVGVDLATSNDLSLGRKSKNGSEVDDSSEDDRGLHFVCFEC